MYRRLSRDQSNADPVPVSLSSDIPAPSRLIHDLSSLPLFVPPSSRPSPRDPNIPDFVSCPPSCLCSHSYYRAYARPRCFSLSRAPSPLPSPVKFVVCPGLTTIFIRRPSLVYWFPFDVLHLPSPVSHSPSLAFPLVFPVILPVAVTVCPYHP